MRYIDIPEFGAPEVLCVKEGERPSPAANEVLIRVRAAGVNRPDVIQRQGFYPAPPGASPVPGLEVAGEVIAVGDSVTTWQPGDQVCALTNGGGYAEFAVAPAGQCLPVPEGLTMVDAAALPETFFTVWSNVFDRAALKPGERFLVHGGSSGIGTTAIQMAKAWGAEVFTTAGNEAKCQACRDLGADLAINYRETDFLEALKTHTEGKGVDVILDMVGGDYIQKNISLAAKEGRIVNIAFLAGPSAKVNFLPVMLKRLHISGSTLRPQSDEAKAAIAQALHEHFWPKLASGSIKPLIAETFPLAEAAKAHALMESNAHIGKIVLLT